jgi:hypothetical protein
MSLPEKSREIRPNQPELTMISHDFPAGRSPPTSSARPSSAPGQKRRCRPRGVLVRPGGLAREIAEVGAKTRL